MQSFETALGAENGKRIIGLLEQILEHQRPKTTDEMMSEIKATSTEEEWSRLVNARLATASLAEVAQAEADARGISVRELARTGGKVITQATPERSE